MSDDTMTCPGCQGIGTVAGATWTPCGICGRTGKVSIKRPEQRAEVFKRNWIARYGFSPTETDIYNAGILYGKNSRPTADESAKPVGYLAADELDRLKSGHDASLRSAKFGPSTLDGDVAVYVGPHAAPVASKEAVSQSEPVAYRYRMSMGEKWHYGPTAQNWWECEGLYAAPLLCASKEAVTLSAIEKEIDGIREAAILWGGWSGTVGACDRVINVIRAAQRDASKAEPTS